MKTGTKVFLGFLGGATVGAISATFGLKYYYEKQITEEIIPSIREDYEERISALEKEMEARRKAREKAKKDSEKATRDLAAKYGFAFDGKTLKPVAKGKKANEESEEKVKLEKSRKNNDKIDTNKTDYTKSYTPGNDDVEEKHVTRMTEKNKTSNGLKIDDQGHVYSKAASKGKPYIISMDEYTDLNGYDKQTYSFWTYDEVFVDENDEPDLNICMYIGHDLMDLWDQYGEDDSLYVRNDQQKTDYEIIIHDRSYAEYMREPDFDEE